MENKQKLDHYLMEQHVTDRLVKEWKKYGKLVIAFDFDNTVFDFHNEGHTYDCVIELLRECKKVGAYLYVYTAREDHELEFLKTYLNEQNIPYDAINQAPEFLPFKGKKLYYNIFLDDRAGLSSAYQSLKKALDIMKQETN